MLFSATKMSLSCSDGLIPRGMVPYTTSSTYTQTVSRAVKRVVGQQRGLIMTGPELECMWLVRQLRETLRCLKCGIPVFEDTHAVVEYKYHDSFTITMNRICRFSRTSSNSMLRNRREDLESWTIKCRALLSGGYESGECIQFGRISFWWFQILLGSSGKTKNIDLNMRIF